MQVDIVTNQERTWHLAFPRLSSSTIYSHLSEFCFSEHRKGKAAWNNRVPYKYTADSQPLWTLVFQEHITISDSRAGLVTLFSMLLGFVLPERGDPVESIGHYPIWGTPVDL